MVRDLEERDLHKLISKVALPILIGLIGIGVSLIIKELCTSEVNPPYSPWGKVKASETSEGDDSISKLKEIIEEVDKTISLINSQIKR